MALVDKWGRTLVEHLVVFFVLVRFFCRDQLVPNQLPLAGRNTVMTGPLLLLQLFSCPCRVNVHSVPAVLQHMLESAVDIGFTPAGRYVVQGMFDAKHPRGVGLGGVVALGSSLFR